MSRNLVIGLGTVSCLAIICGILIELLIGGDAGYIIISVGCLGVMVGSLIYAKKFIKEP